MILGRLCQYSDCCLQFRRAKGHLHLESYCRLQESDPEIVDSTPEIAALKRRTVSNLRSFAKTCESVHSFQFLAFLNSNVDSLYLNSPSQPIGGTSTCHLQGTAFTILTIHKNIRVKILFITNLHGKIPTKKNQSQCI